MACAFGGHADHLPGRHRHLGGERCVPVDSGRLRSVAHVPQLGRVVVQHRRRCPAAQRRPPRRQRRPPQGVPARRCPVRFWFRAVRHRPQPPVADCGPGAAGGGWRCHHGVVVRRDAARVRPVQAQHRHRHRGGHRISGCGNRACTGLGADRRVQLARDLPHQRAAVLAGAGAGPPLAQRIERPRRHRAHRLAWRADRHRRRVLRDVRHRAERDLGHRRPQSGGGHRVGSGVVAPAGQAVAHIPNR